MSDGSQSHTYEQFVLHGNARTHTPRAFRHRYCTKASDIDANGLRK